MRRTVGLCTIGALVALVVGAAMAQQTSTPKTAACGEHKMVTPSQLAWGPPPPGLPHAAEVAVLEGDPSRAGYYAVRLRLPEGTQIRPHWHSQDEHITVLSGTLGMGMGDKWNVSTMTPLGIGSYFALPGGQHHFAQARGDTILQVSGLGPFDIHYVNPNDDPRQARSSR